MNGEEIIGMRRYIERIFAERDARQCERDKRVEERFQAIERSTSLALAERDKAIDKAESAAKETMRSHNDLIRQSRDRDATYATKAELGHTIASIEKLERFQSKLLGAMALAMFLMPTVTAVIVYLISRK